MVFSDGHSYLGWIKQGKLHGYGLSVETNGDIIEGLFAEHTKKGMEEIKTYYDYRSSFEALTFDKDKYMIQTEKRS